MEIEDFIEKLKFMKEQNALLKTENNALKKQLDMLLKEEKNSLDDAFCMLVKTVNKIHKITEETRCKIDDLSDDMLLSRLKIYDFDEEEDYE